MATLTEDMQRVVREQRLGFYATVCEDGTPNLSPKGTSFVLDDEHLLFADIRSPQTVANVRRGSWVELNVVDPLVRKGYRFKGPAVVHDPGSAGFESGLQLLREAGSSLVDRVRAIVVVEVREARPVVSPAYDAGTATEAEIVRTFQERFARTPRHLAFDPSAFRWEGVEERDYKESEGTRRGMGWRGLIRHTLVPGGSVAAGFEQRYFELEPGGYSSLEKHEHAHVVVTLRGRGRVLVGDRVVELGPMELLEIPPLAAHRWVNAGEEPWGFLCTVDARRDRPQPLGDAEWEALKADPATAAFVF